MDEECLLLHQLNSDMTELRHIAFCYQKYINDGDPIEQSMFYKIIIIYVDKATRRQIFRARTKVRIVRTISGDAQGQPAK